MVGRRAAGRSRGGGESIPPLRSIRVRLVAAVAAAAIAAGLAIYPVLRAGSLAPLVDTLSAVAVCSLLLPLFWHARGVWLPLFLLATEFVIVEPGGRAAVPLLAVYGSGLIVLCELLFWSAELPRSALVDRAVVGRRLLSLGVTALAAVLLAMVTLLAVAVRLDSALGAALLGAFAAAALLAIPWLLLRERNRSG